MGHYDECRVADELRNFTPTKKEIKEIEEFIKKQPNKSFTAYNEDYGSSRVAKIASYSNKLIVKTGGYKETIISFKEKK